MALTVCAPSHVRGTQLPPNIPGGFQDDRLLVLGAAVGKKGSRASRTVDAVVPRQRHAYLDRALFREGHRQSLRACQGMILVRR